MVKFYIILSSVSNKKEQPIIRRNEKNEKEIDVSKKIRPYHVEHAEVITECDPDIQVG